MRQLCVDRDMKHLGSLESTQEARVANFPRASCDRSKTSASFSSGVPNTEKERCLEPLMKNEAPVFYMASQTSVGI